MNCPNRAKTTIQAGLFLVVAASGGRAWAQDTSAESVRAPVHAPAAGEYAPVLGQPQMGDGIRLSDSAVLNVGVSAEAGYDTNVFYTKETPTPSAILLVTPFFNINNRSRSGTVPSQFTYQFGASLQYREYLDENPNVKAQRGFNPTATLGLASNGPKLGFAFTDTFSRIEEPSYGVSTETIKHNHNLGQIQLRMSPGGGRLADSIGYRNMLDMFDDLKYANNMQHELWNELGYKWLPKTSVYLRLSGNYTHFLQEDMANPRNNSFGLGAVLGLRGLVTAKLSLDASLGYGTAFFENDTQVSGLAQLSGRLGFLYRPTPFTDLGLAYEHGFRVSPLIGDYYDLNTAILTIDQAVGNRLVLGVEGRYEHRIYRGFSFAMSSVDRRDHIIIGGARLDYYIQKWFYAGIGYTITFNESNFDAVMANAVGVDYAKHQILGRIGVTY